MPEWRRQLGKPTRRWKDIIKVDFKEIGRKVVDWIRLAQDRRQFWMLGCCELGEKPLGFMKRREYFYLLSDC
jgi:hypothetical protein